MGPNISVLKGKHRDFWDNRLALSEASLNELWEIKRFSSKYRLPNSCHTIWSV